ncbi:hypothetical protein M408DRAFT_327623 [Serendipita vermifera MAFF 305830]|uniref:Carbohydrate phosphatase n=1 Tax=Serendipita vermifera MAFF 305830 TaxID=933852 RepID=A0A0C2WZA0_SERVB|nr:hypothetical protein M408DRAFT_327623 [Serendipita vermifera MAFF 305830]
MTWDIKSQLMGKPERAGAELLWSLLPGIEHDFSIDAYLIERREQQDLAWPFVPLLPGASKLIRHLHAHKIPMCVATGSIRRNFEMKTMDPRADAEKREVFALFDGRIVCGDDSQLRRGPWTKDGEIEKVVRGKPAPDIFLSAAEMIGRPVGREETPSTEEAAERGRGLVFEDGIPGVQAALKAGMQVVWVPDSNLLALDPDLQVVPTPSLLDFKPEEWGLPAYDSPLN